MKIIIKILLRILAEQKKQTLLTDKTAKAIDDLATALQNLDQTIINRL